MTNTVDKPLPAQRAVPTTAPLEAPCQAGMGMSGSPGRFKAARHTLQLSEPGVPQGWQLA